MITFAERLDMMHNLDLNPFFSQFYAFRDYYVELQKEMSRERSSLSVGNNKGRKYVEKQSQLYEKAYFNTIGKFMPLMEWWQKSYEWVSGWLVIDIADMSKEEIEATITGIAMAEIDTFCIIARKDLLATKMAIVLKMGYGFTPRYAERPITEIPIRKEKNVDEMLSVYFLTKTHGGL